MSMDAIFGRLDGDKRFLNRGLWDGFLAGYNSMETGGGSFGYSSRTRHAVYSTSGTIFFRCE